MQFLRAPDKAAARLRLVVFDFDGVFTDNSVYVNEKGEEMIRCFRGDGLGLRKLQEAGVAAWVVSSEMNKAVLARCKKLNVHCIQKLLNKEKELAWLARRLKIEFSKIAFVGNDINDIECLKLVGVPIVVADASREAKQFAKYQTQKSGGFGAVREVCDWIFKSKL